MKSKELNTGMTNVTSFDKEKEKMQRQMFSSLSHDLKTPLASMIGSLEIYERMKDKLTLDKKELLIATALQEAYRLDNFVTNILDMAKLESGMVKIRSESFDVGILLRDCLTNLDNRLRGSDVTIEPLSGDMKIKSDASLVCRALSLLIDNAVKYGGNPSTIRITYGKDVSGKFQICVYDNGRGIAEANMENIFSKYTRFVKSDQQSAGTGLGLAICREIMRLLGGMATVTNDSNGGAKFTLLFPEQSYT